MEFVLQVLSSVKRKEKHVKTETKSWKELKGSESNELGQRVHFQVHDAFRVSSQTESDPEVFILETRRCEEFSHDATPPSCRPRPLSSRSNVVNVFT